MGTKEPFGQVSKLFGAKGELVVRLADPDAKIDMKEPLWVGIDSLEVPLFLDSFNPQGKSRAVVRFADMDTERRALELVGKELFIERAGGAVSDEQDEQDEQAGAGALMIGYAALLDKQTRGEIVDFYDGPNPLFGVKVDGREALVPAGLVKKVSRRRREIAFELPENFLEVFLQE